MPSGDVEDTLGHPLIVGIVQCEAGHVIVCMCVEACRDKDELWLERLKRRQPVFANAFTEGLPVSPRREGNIDQAS